MNDTSTHDMNERQRIADEAVGERPASAIPEAARNRVPEIAPALSAGPLASVATRTAEALGERTGGAYAYPDATPEEVRSLSHAAVGHGTRRTGTGWGGKLMIAAAGFAVGYVASLLIHHRS